MATRAQILVGLDIGTTVIKVAVGEVTADGRLDVIGIGTSASRGLRKGVVINIESTVHSIAKAVAQAETMAGCEISAVFASISGGHIKCLNSHGIVGVKGKEVSALDVERVIEAAKAVALPPDREVLHVLPQEFIIDEQDGIREPIGISGVRLEANVHIITGSIASAQNVVKCANRCGLAVEDIVVGPLAAARSVVSTEEQELGVCVIDIGGGTTDVVVYQHGSVAYTSVMSVGGNHITSDIAAGLRTPMAAAEQIKCQHGSALAGMVSQAETIEVPSTGGRPPRIVSKMVLAEIIEPRISEVLQLVHNDMTRSGSAEGLTSGIVLTGGGSALPGMVRLAEQIFNLPVRLGTPAGVGGLVDLVKGPENAAVVGLLLHGAQNRGTRRPATARTFVGRTISRVTSWFGEQF
jgi:cell division protein FtsA